MNYRTDRATPEHFAKAINDSIETILREECERLENTIVCQLRASVRARLKQLVPTVRAALTRHVFDLELKVDVKLDGEDITTAPAQPVLQTPKPYCALHHGLHPDERCTCGDATPKPTCDCGPGRQKQKPARLACE